MKNGIDVRELFEETREVTEYRVREVKRYIVTKCKRRTVTHADGTESGDGGSVGQVSGEYASAYTAYEVAYALCSMEHTQSGEPLDSPNFVYPTHPSESLSNG